MDMTVNNISQTAREKLVTGICDGLDEARSAYMLKVIDATVDRLRGTLTSFTAAKMSLPISRQIIGYQIPVVQPGEFVDKLHAYIFSTAVLLQLFEMMEGPALEQAEFLVDLRASFMVHHSNLFDENITA